MTEQEQLILDKLEEFHTTRYMFGKNLLTPELQEKIVTGFDPSLTVIENAKRLGVNSRSMDKYCKILGLISTHPLAVKTRNMRRVAAERRGVDPTYVKSRTIWHLIRGSTCEYGEKYAVIEFLLEQPDVCSLIDVPISWGTKVCDPNRTASVDRIDSSKPYEIGNVRLVHKTVNMFIGSIDDTLLNLIAERIISTRESRRDFIRRSANHSKTQSGA